MAISRILIGSNSGMGSIKLLKYPFQPLLRIPESSITKIAIKANAAVTFKSFVGDVSPKTPQRLENAIYIAIVPKNAR